MLNNIALPRDAICPGRALGTSQYSANVRLSHAIYRTYFTLQHCPAKRNNFRNLAVSQFDEVIGLAASRINSLTTFCNHIYHIIGVSAKKQVGRIDTQRVVAGMADTHAVVSGAWRNRANICLIRCAVSKHHIFSADSNASIAGRAHSALPQPANIWRKTRKLRLKSLLKGFHATLLFAAISVATKCNLCKPDTNHSQKGAASDLRGKYYRKSAFVAMKNTVVADGA